MAKKIVRHRLYTWFEDVANEAAPGGVVQRERIAHLGQTIDVTNDLHLRRGEALDAFFSDADAAAIEAGTYNGPAADDVYRARRGVFRGEPTILPVDGEGAGEQRMDAADLALVIRPPEGKGLNQEQTVALAGETAESIQKVIDAENIATGNSPRVGVIDALEKMLLKVEE